MKRVITSSLQSNSNELNELKAELNSFKGQLSNCSVEIDVVKHQSSNVDALCAYASVTGLNGVSNKSVVWDYLLNDIPEYGIEIDSNIYMMLPMSHILFDANNLDLEAIISRFNQDVISEISEKSDLCLDFLDSVQMDQLVDYIYSNSKLAELYESGEALGLSISSTNPGTVYFYTQDSTFHIASARISTDILGNPKESGRSQLQEDALKAAELLGNRNLFVSEEDDYLLFTNYKRTKDIEIPLNVIEGYRNVQDLAKIVRKYSREYYGVKF